jgi:hypothetical protein
MELRRLQVIEANRVDIVAHPATVVGSHDRPGDTPQSAPRNHSEGEGCVVSLPEPQSGVSGRPVALPLLVLTGLSRSGLREWIFLPKGWDVQALQRRFRFSGTARSRTRQCLATPVSVAEMVAVYGDTSLTPQASPRRLATLLSHTVIAVELTVLKDASAIAEAIADARSNRR